MRRMPVKSATSPPQFQNLYLLGESNRLLRVFHVKKKRPTLVRWSYDEKRGGICCCKGTQILSILQILGQCYCTDWPLSVKKRLIFTIF